ncbi:gamma-glutamyltransferase [Escherichia coli]
MDDLFYRQNRAYRRHFYGLVGGDANAVGPNKRPLASMSPTIVVKDGKNLVSDW